LSSFFLPAFKFLGHFAHCKFTAVLPTATTTKHSYKYQLHTAAMPTATETTKASGEFCQVFLLSLIANLNSNNNWRTPSHKKGGTYRKRGKQGLFLA